MAPPESLRPTMSGRVALAIPVLDEEEAIGRVVAEVPRELVSRIIIADGGSTDRTIERARQAGAEVIETRRGYGCACLAATEAAGDADIVVFMDGDGADDPRCIASLIEPIHSGACDLVLGSRVRGTREPGSMAWHQVGAGIAIGLGVGLLYGVRYTDMCAFRAIRRDALLGLGMREMTFGWNLEMQMRAARAGLRIREVPVPNRRRIGGKSKVAGSLRGSVRAGARILSTFLRVVAERPVPAGTPHAIARK